ncbi:MAG TPA: DUF1295 domain-containing protein [Spirochaetota bacterium]|nr:DUF1295 domain-containing protein [Spirochaetota bacterium]HPC41203.1 DUF1295 domain-containing protein [Spirochaetota bacterium]HQF08185.1 DUF1295 domain-containing protein [Spirochaetota bacterium]HQH96928.1 DUF1295 domain-containing protein [Spirochaetota bacterium]HQJ70110.1 DUF1295 domain-containing protein [Spirochaetota bacterium]
MEELTLYYIVLFTFLALGVGVFIALQHMAAPYGRYATRKWGPMLNNRFGWIIQEAPASVMMFFYFFISGRPSTIATVLLLAIWQAHYFHRAFIYPFSLRGSNPVPLTTVLLAFLFNMVNSYVQGRWIFTLAPESRYTAAWLADPRFIIGVLLFFTGWAVNKHSDHVLAALRAPGEKGYRIPHGGLYEYVSCPNYLGEMITWLGWTIATWSVGGIFFLLWTIFNLGPRAFQHHAWYKKTFPDYPAKRKALIPFVI